MSMYSTVEINGYEYGLMTLKQILIKEKSTVAHLICYILFFILYYAACMLVNVPL